MAPAFDRTRVVDRLVAWSPLLLLGGLAALTWWLDAQVAAPASGRDGNMRHDPDLIVQGVRAVDLDAQGNPVLTVAAQHARHYPDDGTVEFDAPRFVMSEPGRPTFSVASDRGRVSGDHENAYFEGNVRATRQAEAGTSGADGDDAAGPITLSTEFLHVIPKQDRAQTDRPVTIEEPRGIIRATGLVLDNEAKTLQLKAQVRGTIEPPQSR
jgi:lipopolysaccharide export system protein LptC